MSRLITHSRCDFWTAFVVLCLACWMILTGRGEAAAPDAADAVRGFYDTLQGAMRDGPALGPGGRYLKLEPAVHQTFDIALMTRLAVGPSWSSLSLEQQQQTAAAFERYVAAVYADRFDSYSGERFEVVGQQSVGGEVLVQTRIVKSNGEPVAIDYLMHRNAETWQVADVYLDGTISELATRRSEFASILRDHGAIGLIAALNKKFELLSGAVRNAS